MSDFNTNFPSSTSSVPIHNTGVQNNSGNNGKPLINSAGRSFKLSISPFKESPLLPDTTISSTFPTKLKLSDKSYSGPLSTFTTPFPDNSNSSGGKTISGNLSSFGQDEEAPAFLSSLNSFRDHENEIGFFVRQCQMAPPLYMFENANHMILSYPMSFFYDSLSTLQNFDATQN